MNIKELIEDFLHERDEDYLKKNPYSRMDPEFIYNEFSLQFELGFYLREKLKSDGYKVYFEKNVKELIEEKFNNNEIRSVEKNIPKGKKREKYIEDCLNEYIKEKSKDFIKKEMDLCIEKKDGDKIVERYSIELKLPTNGAYPRRMSQFLDDIQFMEHVKDFPDRAVKSKTFCLSLIDVERQGIPFMALENGYKADDEKIDEKIYPFFRSKESYDNSKKEIEAIKEIKDRKIEKKDTNGNALSFYIKGPYTIKWKKINERFWYYLLEAK